MWYGWILWNKFAALRWLPFTDVLTVMSFSACWRRRRLLSISHMQIAARNSERITCIIVAKREIFACHNTPFDVFCVIACNLWWCGRCRWRREVKHGNQILFKLKLQKISTSLLLNLSAYNRCLVSQVVIWVLCNSPHANDSLSTTFNPIRDITKYPLHCSFSLLLK